MHAIATTGTSCCTRPPEAPSKNTWMIDLWRQKVHLPPTGAPCCCLMEGKPLISACTLSEIILRDPKKLPCKLWKIAFDNFTNLQSSCDYASDLRFSAGRSQMCLNRYNNNLPCDETLHAPRGDDRVQPYYCNASKVNIAGLEYVAAQAPMDYTINEFWKAVVFGGSNKIISLVMEFENGCSKCSSFWIEQKRCLMDGEIFLGSIVLEKEENLAGNPNEQAIVKRTFKWTSAHGTDSREITQYHYLNWPDHGVPDMQLYNAFQDEVAAEATAGPLFVHCSAGLGRTGTSIATDCLRHQIDAALAVGRKPNEISIDIFKLIKEMRCCRPGMVMNEDQVACIHNSIQQRYLSLTL